MSLSDWIDELRDMVRRRFWLIVRLTVLGCVAALLYALSQEHEYTSQAVLQVEDAKVADALAPPTVSGADARQLQIVEQRVMSHDAVLDIAAEVGVLDEMGGLPDSEKVSILRRSLSVSAVAAARTGTTGDGAISLVRVTATWGDRETAQALAEEVTRRTVALSQNKRLERAEETLSFFTLRQSRLEAEVADLEETLANFRKRNDMPEEGARASQEREIEALRAEILSVERQMIVLERQLEREAGDGNLTRLEQRERDENIARLNDLTEQRDYLTESLAAVSAAGDIDPALQAELTRLTRTLLAKKEELASVSESRKAAEIGFQLESEGQSEHLSVLEPASWPDYPSTPSRTKFAVLGAFASVMVAFGIALLLDLMNPVIRSAAVMERDLGFAPVAVIPEAPRSKRRTALMRAFRGRRRAV
ncbi:Wzz/FepE/Etk N-terminal domain-containing protein [Roseovarius sp.]|uniref:GumC family protein n=1 Tax=Roseovarius sp. TaxID=1486281 RepID=UPI0026133E88|nr:Wzz/FepE/Etk N-terminal domain-containing protein [Roseovarius sp.]MDM8164548.1 Wzz/FepE/Etk N-terminal domain-containing protein [Roseovarius sp.]